jgi:hypothetical protein
MKKKAKKRTGMTAAEIMAELSADPKWVAAQEAEERDRLAHYKEVLRVEEPITKELRRVGVDVESVSDLVNTAEPYPEALPILLKHLTRAYPRDTRESIARALAVPDAVFAWKTVRRLFENEADEDVKDGLAVALSGMCDDEHLDELIKLAANRKYGPSRILLLGALERSRDPKVKRALMAFGADPDLEFAVQRILKKWAKREQRKKGQAKGR